MHTVEEKCLVRAHNCALTMCMSTHGIITFIIMVFPVQTETDEIIAMDIRTQCAAQQC